MSSKQNVQSMQATTPATASFPREAPLQVHDSWEASLLIYTKSSESTPPAARSKGEALLAALREAPESAQRWLELLRNEEELLSYCTNPLDAATNGGRNGVTLFHLYEWATKTIPKRGAEQHGDALLHIWLGYARHQGYLQEEDARDTFKALRLQRFGERSAYLYREWAMFELSKGNRKEASARLKKGLKLGVEPASLLHDAIQEVEKEGVVGPAGSSQDSATHTQSLERTSTMTLSSSEACVMETTATVTVGGLPLSRVAETPTGSVLPGSGSSGDDNGRTLGVLGGIGGAAGGAASGAAHAEAADLSGQLTRTVTLSFATPRQHQHQSLQQPGGGLGAGASAQHTSGSAARQTHSHTKPLRRLGGLRGLGGPARRVVPGTEEAQKKAEDSAEGPRPDAQGAEPSSSSAALPRDGAAAAGVGTAAEESVDGGSGGRKRKAEESSSSASASAGTGSAASDAAAPPGPAATPIPAPSGPSKVQLQAEEAVRDPAPAPAPPPPGPAPGAPPPSDAFLGPGGGEGTGEEADEDTIPIDRSSLAKRVLKGRASLAPGHAMAAMAAASTTAAQSQQPNQAPLQPASSPIGGALVVSAGGSSTRAPTETKVAPGHNDNEENLQHQQQRHAAAPPLPQQPPPAPSGVAPAAAAVQAQHQQGNSHPSAQRPQRPASAAAPPTFAASGAPPKLPQQQAIKAAAESAAARAPPAPNSAQQPGQGPSAAAPSRPREDDKSVTVKGVRYTKLEVVGRGGSSKVFKVIAPNHQIYALKRIRLHGRDSESATGFVDEIRMLHKLRKKENIIQLVDAEVVERDKTIYLVLEYGEIDLATILARKERQRAAEQEGLDENFIRLAWQSMLQAVGTIHDERIVHSDLKPANFIFVKGQLKLLDFGIAKNMQADTTSIVRENQVGTLNYMSPEAILGGSNNIRGSEPMRVGRASDIWALGCILYQMVHGSTPFAALPFIQKMHAITDPNHAIRFPTLRNAALQAVLEGTLDRNPATRIDLQQLLAHPFLHPEAAAAAQAHAPAAAARPQPTAAAASAVGMTKEHLTAMLAAMVSASGGDDQVDVGSLADLVFHKLSLGEQPDFAGVVSAAVSRSRAASGQQQGMAVSTQGRSSLAPQTPANASAGQEVSKSNNQDFRAASGRPPKPHSGSSGALRSGAQTSDSGKENHRAA